MNNKRYNIEKSTLNRVKDEDILICNPRRALPRFISKDEFDNKIISKLNMEDTLFIKQYYKKIIELIDKNQTEIMDSYMLNTVPFYLKRDDVAQRNLQKRDLNFLLKYYTMTDDGYKLKEIYIDESSEYLILSILKEKELWIDDYTRTKLYMILEKCNFTVAPSVYYCTIKEGTTHYYFYHKDYEHIPGVMLLEAGRQACYIYIFKFWGFDNKDINLAVSKINIEYLNYVQSNFPIQIKIIKPMEINDTYTDTGVQRFCIHIGIFQLGNMMCDIKFHGTIIRKDIFNEIRTNTFETENLWFIPMRNIYEKVVLLDQKGHQYELDLKKISSKKLEVEYHESILTELEEYNFTIYIEKYGLISGKCKVSSYQKNENIFTFILKIKEMSEENYHRLNEAIKIYSFVENEKEII